MIALASNVAAAKVETKAAANPSETVAPVRSAAPRNSISASSLPTGANLAISKKNTQINSDETPDAANADESDSSDARDNVESPASSAVDEDEADKNNEIEEMGDVQVIRSIDGPAGTPIETSQQIEIVDNVETVDVVEIVDGVIPAVAPSKNDTQNEPSSLKVLGRLHPAFVHLPLGLLIALLLFELLRIKDTSHSRYGAVLWLITPAAFLPAIVSGLIRATELVQLGASPSVSAHRNWMLASLLLLVIAAGLWFTPGASNSPRARIVRVTLVALATIFAFLGAHLGGKMVYGPDFLPF